MTGVAGKNDNYDLEILKTKRIGIVHTAWHSETVYKMLDGALKILRQYALEEVRYVQVPGAYELPSGVQIMMKDSRGESGINRKERLAIYSDHYVGVPYARQMRSGLFEGYYGGSPTPPLRPYDAVIALGLVLRGETPHFDYICSSVAHGLSRVSLDLMVPVIFGVLTLDDPEQIESRLIKGEEAAHAALRMAELNCHPW